MIIMRLARGVVVGACRGWQAAVGNVTLKLLTWPNTGKTQLADNPTSPSDII